MLDGICLLPVNKTNYYPNRKGEKHMDDLLREFLTESGESLSELDVELVQFEQDPNDDALLGNIFRLMHTIKGTCGFLGV